MGGRSRPEQGRDNFYTVRLGLWIGDSGWDNGWDNGLENGWDNGLGNRLGNGWGLRRLGSRGKFRERCNHRPLSLNWNQAQERFAYAQDLPSPPRNHLPRL